MLDTRRRLLQWTLALPVAVGLTAHAPALAAAEEQKKFQPKDLEGTTLYLLRHATTEANLAGRDYRYAPDYEVVTAPILSGAEMAIRAVGDYFNANKIVVDAALSSEYTRCAETAALVSAGSGGSIWFEFDARLNDYHSFKSMSFETFAEQTLGLLSSLGARAESRNVLLLSHGGNIGAITAAARTGRVLREDFDNRALRPRPGQVVIIRSTKGAPPEVTRYPA